MVIPKKPVKEYAREIKSERTYYIYGKWRINVRESQSQKSHYDRAKL